MYVAKMVELLNKTRLIKQAYCFELQNNALEEIQHFFQEAENCIDEAIGYLKDARVIDNVNFKIATYSLIEETLEMAGVHYFNAVLFTEQSQCDYHIKKLLVAHCSHQIKSIKAMSIKDEI